MKKQNGEITIKELLNIFIPKLWFILLVAVLCSALLGTFTSMKKDTYTSTCTLSMGKTPLDNANSSNTGINTAEIEAMRNMIESSVYILQSASFCENVYKRLNEQYDEYSNVKVSDIQKMLSVTLLGEATFFSIHAKSGDPKLSQAVAGIVYTEFPKAYMERFDYAIRITGNLNYPEIPKTPDDKNVARNAIIGFVGGALVSALLVFLVVKFDVIVRSREKLEENFDLPVLGVIPRLDPDD